MNNNDTNNFIAYNAKNVVPDKCMTYRQLLCKLEVLTPEELDMPVSVSSPSSDWDAVVWQVEIEKADGQPYMIYW